jgi:hypothetical protein
VGDGVLATAADGAIVFCQFAAWQFEHQTQTNLRRTFRHLACLTARLTANQGVPTATPLLGRFRSPVTAGQMERRWLSGFYLDVPEEWDDPYRFFRW